MAVGPRLPASNLRTSSPKKSTGTAGTLKEGGYTRWFPLFSHMAMGQNPNRLPPSEHPIQFPLK